MQRVFKTSFESFSHFYFQLLWKNKTFKAQTADTSNKKESKDKSFPEHTRSWKNAKFIVLLLVHLQLHSSWHLMLILTQEHTFLITNHQDTHQAVSDSNIYSISAIQIWKTNNWKKILFFFCPLWMVLSHSLSSALHEWKDTLRLTDWLLILLCNKSLLQIFQIVEYLSAWCNKSNTYLLFFSCLKVS